MAPSENQGTDPRLVIGYVRVGRSDTSDGHVGIDGQVAMLTTETERRGWHLVFVEEDAGVPAAHRGRPGLSRALAMLRAGDVGTLVVTKLDRLAGSVGDAAKLLSRSRSEGWSLVALDVGLDTTTSAGSLVADILIAAAPGKQGVATGSVRAVRTVRRTEGVQLGRPRTLPSAVTERIVAAHERGEGWTAIARGLNTDQVPTAHGGARWYPSTVKAVVLARQTQREL